MTSAPLGNDEGVLREVSGFGVACYAAACNGQVAPLPFPLVNTPVWTVPLLIQPSFVIACLIVCLPPQSAPSMGTGTGTVSFGAGVFQALDKYRLDGLINELVRTYLV